MNADDVKTLAYQEVQLRRTIEDAAITRLVDAPALLKATGSQQRIIEAYYKTLAETNDEMLALRAAREVAY